MGVATSDGFSLRSGFLHSVKSHPLSLALRIGDRKYTYLQVDELARKWATRIVDAGNGKARRVGIFAYRSEVSYIGTLASLLAGGTFVPLSRRFPVERTRRMIAMADLDVILADAESAPQLSEVLQGLPRQPAIVLPDADVQLPMTRVFGRRDVEAAAPLQALPDIGPDDFAYLLFTSGSTGAPKGVPINHSNVRAFLDFNRERYQLTSADRLSQTFDQTFDLSIFDLFMAWESGAAVCAMDPIQLLSPFRYLEEQQISVWFSVPSVANQLHKRGLLTPGRMRSLRLSLFCGEALPSATAQAWQEAAPSSIVENLYGPTELTIACSQYRWDSATSPAEAVGGLVPIGQIYPGMVSLVVDESHGEVAEGEVGELCVSGPQTAVGYWRAPEVTAERFFDRTGSDGVTRTFYRTGDWVQWRGKHYVYQGRSDHQIKIGGYRIELGEIESALRMAGCVEAIAIPVTDPQIGDHVTAVVSGAIDLDCLAKTVRKSLPWYMVPRTIQTIEEFPLNSNGKIDRNALRDLMQPTVPAV